MTEIKLNQKENTVKIKANRFLRKRRISLLSHYSLSNEFRKWRSMIKKGSNNEMQIFWAHNVWGLQSQL